MRERAQRAAPKIEMFAMKPHVICHVAASIDGRTLPSRWRPEAWQRPGVYERLHEELRGDAW